MTRQNRKCQLPAFRAVILVAALLALIGPSGQDAFAQTNRTLKIVVPYPPGGGVDTTARRLADQISRNQGIAAVIDNRPGGGTIIGTEAVARAAPDGNTVLILTNTFVVTPQLKQVNYHALTSFEPICNLVSTPTIVVVHNNSAYRTLADLLDAARRKPGSLTLASVPGTFLSLSFEMLQRAAQVNLNFVPYNGTAPAIAALLGEHVDAVLVDYSTVLEQIRSGALRGLATGSRSRVEALPNVPTVDESGYPGYETDLWYGAFAPAKTPRDIISSLSGWFSAALQSPEIKSTLISQGLYPTGACGDEFKEYVRVQYEKYGKVIRDANIKSE